MALLSRRALVNIAVGALMLLAMGFALVWFGFYNVAADDPHIRPMYAFLETVRDRSIARRAGAIEVPTLTDEAAIVQGAGNYDAMCTGCHLKPGAAPTELSRGLYPAPPNLTLAAPDPARAFWVVKHGVKASGMPAWGASMDDAYIWNMVAFLQVLPSLDAAGYAAMVERSGGHSHGGGETDGHAQVDAAPEPALSTHVHGDGSTHVHADGSAAPGAVRGASEETQGEQSEDAPPAGTESRDADVRPHHDH